MDYRTLLYRAIGVPDAVVDKTEAAAWMVLSGAGLESHDRVDLLLRRLHDGTAAAVVDDIVLRLEAGEFDPLFVHRPGTTVDEIAGRIEAGNRTAALDAALTAILEKVPFAAPKTLVMNVTAVEPSGW